MKTFMYIFLSFLFLMLSSCKRPGDQCDDDSDCKKPYTCVLMPFRICLLPEDYNPDNRLYNHDKGAFVTSWLVEKEDRDSDKGYMKLYAMGPVEVDCDNDGVYDFQSSGWFKCEYEERGYYNIAIKGQIPSFRVNFGSGGDFLDVLQWGTNKWQIMEEMFFSEFDDDAFQGEKFSAIDIPDLSQCLNMKNMFKGASSFNQDLSLWDVSNVENMEGMFEDASSFNQDLSLWNVSNVENMGSMFKGASSFNQNLSSWNVPNVTKCWHFSLDSGLPSEHLPIFEHEDCVN